ncbi:hypothetical protein FB451DRAFT_275640 [Mycena latifolia]|nr:hypothetical protein FB451DRAFT_275640 [Mycena latifolia]
MMEANQIEPEIVAAIIYSTVQLATTVGYKPSGHATTHIYKQICNFCTKYPNPNSVGWTNTVGSALALAKREDGELAETEVLLVYQVLEHFHSGDIEDPWRLDTARVIGELLLALAGSPAHSKPPDTVFRVALDALAQPNTVYPAFLFLCRSESWFLNKGLRTMMQNHSVWAILGETTLSDTGRMAKEYIEVGDKLSKLPEWGAHIYNDPFSWINVYVQMDPSKRQERQRHQFQSVLHRVWNAWGRADSGDEDEDTLIRLFKMLSNIWEHFEFSTAKAEDFFRLARCTASTALRGHYTHSQYHFAGGWPVKVVEKRISSGFKQNYFKLLSRTLVVAACSARSNITTSRSETDGLELDNFPQNGRFNLEGAAIILEEMGNKLAEDESGQNEIEDEENYWESLSERFLQDIDVLEHQTLQEIDVLKYQTLKLTECGNAMM